MGVYLDNAASTRMSERVIEAVTEAMRECYGNASSAHGAGMAARGEVEKARFVVGSYFGAKPDRVVFTSGATEANNSALCHYATQGKRQGRRHIVVSAIEHKSVLEYCRRLKDEQGFYISVVSPDAIGQISVDSVRRAIRKTTCLVCVMAVNNETGVVQPYREIAKLCADRGIPFHCDGTQAVGKVEFGIGMEGSSFSFSGHKIHGPKGVGALVLPEGQYSFYQTFVGGAQESGRRAGTENVPGIVGLSVALSEESLENGSLCRQRILRGRLFAGLLQEVGGVVLNGNLERSIPNILNVSFEGINGGSLISMLSNLYGIYCSTGSACQSGESVPSHVLTSMGIAPDLALGAVRFSVSKYTTEEEIEKTISAIKKCASDLR